MKKTMITLAAMFAATVTMAAVTSQVVGYMNYAVPESGWFVNVAPVLKNMATQNGDYVITGDMVDDWEQIIVFNPDTWNVDTYTYSGDGTFDLSQIDSATGEAFSQTVNEINVPVGAGFLYMGIRTLTVSGEVAASGTRTVSFDMSEGAWAFSIANPFPVQTTLGDLEGLISDWEQIVVFNGDTWNLDTYTYSGSGEWDLSVIDSGTGDAVSTTITDPEYVIFKIGEAGVYMPSETKSWSVTYNY